MSITRYLIVNADDYARSSEVNTGIHHAHLCGIVTTTTVLINMPGALQALHDGHQTCPALGFGLHLNLTLGEPCWESSSALVGSDGQFYPLHHWHELHQEHPISSIRAEWTAQIEKFLASGISMDHLDSHHHIATLRPDIFQLYLQLAKELNCGVRPPYPDDVSQEDMRASFPATMIETARGIALPAMKQSAVPHPDTFLASFFDKHAQLAHLLHLLETLPPGISEIMCHPGFSSTSLEETSSYAQQRVVELGALTDAKTIQKVKDQNITLGTYRQVWPKL